MNDTLPPLPQPAGVFFATGPKGRVKIEQYTADQMHAYARIALARSNVTGPGPAEQRAQQDKKESKP